jgi:hypothetical protein
MNSIQDGKDGKRNANRDVKQKVPRPFPFCFVSGSVHGLMACSVGCGGSLDNETLEHRSVGVPQSSLSQVSHSAALHDVVIGNGLLREYETVSTKNIGS